MRDFGKSILICYTYFINKRFRPCQDFILSFEVSHCVIGKSDDNESKLIGNLNFFQICRSSHRKRWGPQTVSCQTDGSPGRSRQAGNVYENHRQRFTMSLLIMRRPRAKPATISDYNEAFNRDYSFPLIRTDISNYIVLKQHQLPLSFH